MTDPTDLSDARAFREMGLPLNTPVIDGGELPAPASKAMLDGFKQAIAFRKSIVAFTANPNASTRIAMRRSFDKFMRKTVCDDPLGASILESEFSSIRAQWSDVFARSDAGEQVHLGPPMWPWVETESTKMRQREHHARG